MSSTKCSNSNFNINKNQIREASHAGSWYSSNFKKLNNELSEWLNKIEPTASGLVRAIISPHAGYAYCGDTAAYAYKQMLPNQIKRIFVFGPSHVQCLSTCALTTCIKYKTPLGDLDVDTEVNKALHKNNLISFDTMQIHNEEEEHSIEMQLPFIAKIMQSRSQGSFTIVPVLVGTLSLSKQVAYGKIFANYLADQENFFVISSDFCHWGHRFHYTPHDPLSKQPIFQQITNLDHQGMDAIAALKSTLFNDYLNKTQNTICGRYPICVMLQAVEHLCQTNNYNFKFHFLKYSQSNKCTQISDSSVSYAAGALFLDS